MIFFKKGQVNKFLYHIIKKKSLSFLKLKLSLLFFFIALAAWIVTSSFVMSLLDNFKSKSSREISKKGNLAYPIVDGIPVMLEDQARKIKWFYV